MASSNGPKEEKDFTVERQLKSLVETKPEFLFLLSNVVATNEIQTISTPIFQVLKKGNTYDIILNLLELSAHATSNPADIFRAQSLISEITFKYISEVLEIKTGYLYNTLIKAARGLTDSMNALAIFRSFADSIFKQPHLAPVEISSFLRVIRDMAETPATGLLACKRLFINCVMYPVISNPFPLDENLNFSKKLKKELSKASKILLQLGETSSKHKDAPEYEGMFSFFLDMVSSVSFVAKTVKSCECCNRSEGLNMNKCKSCQKETCVACFNKGNCHLCGGRASCPRKQEEEPEKETEQKKDTEKDTQKKEKSKKKREKVARSSRRLTEIGKKRTLGKEQKWESKSPAQSVSPLSQSDPRTSSNSDPMTYQARGCLSARSPDGQNPQRMTFLRRKAESISCGSGDDLMVLEELNSVKNALGFYRQPLISLLDIFPRLANEELSTFIHAIKPIQTPTKKESRRSTFLNRNFSLQLDKKTEHSDGLLELSIPKKSQTHRSASANQNINCIPFVEEFDHEVRYMEGTKDVIKAATCNRLIDALCQNADTKFRDSFLMTYRAFISPDDFLGNLIDRYQIEEKNPDAVLTKKRVRLVGVVKAWIEKFFFDFRDDPVLKQTLCNFLEQMKKTMLSSSERLRKVYHKQENGKTEKAPSPAPPFTTSRALSPHSTGEWTEIPEVTLAEQMTLLESAISCRILPKECVAWNKSDKEKYSPNICQMIQRFNEVSAWVRWVLVKEVKKNSRAELLKRFIRLMEELQTLNNYNGMMEILTGLNSSPVRRMKQTFEEVGPEYCDRLSVIENLLSHKSNYHELRQNLRVIAPPCIPYLGVYLADLTYVLEENPDRIEKDLINFSKYQKLADTIFEIKMYQVSYLNIETDPSIQSFLSSLEVMDEDMCFKWSSRVEPTDFEKTIDELLKSEKQLTQNLAALKEKEANLCQRYKSLTGKDFDHSPLASRTLVGPVASSFQISGFKIEGHGCGHEDEDEDESDKEKSDREDKTDGNDGEEDEKSGDSGQTSGEGRMSDYEFPITDPIATPPRAERKKKTKRRKMEIES